MIALHLQPLIASFTFTAIQFCESKEFNLHLRLELQQRKRERTSINQTTINVIIINIFFLSRSAY